MTPRQLISEAALEITVTQTITCLEILNKALPHNLAGVYIFYTAGRHEVLYVGVSKRLRDRLYSHLQLSGRGNPDIFQYYQVHKDFTVDIIEESDEGYRELIESYLILQHNPRYNISKIERQRV